MLGFTIGKSVTGAETVGFFLNQVAGFIFFNMPAPFSGVGAGRMGLIGLSKLFEITVVGLLTLAIRTSSAAFTGGGSSGNRATSTGISLFGGGWLLGE